MTDLKFSVETIFVQRLCEKCKAGYMTYTGSHLEAKEPSYHHQCSNPACQVVNYIRGQQFPQIRNIVEEAALPGNVSNIDIEKHTIQPVDDQNKTNLSII